MWKCLWHLLIGGRSRFIWHLNSTVSLSVTCFSSDLIIRRLTWHLNSTLYSSPTLLFFHQPWGSNRGKPQVLTQCARNINSIISTFIVGSSSQHLYGSLLSPKAGVNVIPVERMQVGSSQGRAGSGSQNSKSISPELWKYFSKMAVFKLGKVPALP